MRRHAALIAILLTAAGGASALPAPPGRYDAELCVATQPEAEPTCGPAEAEVAPARISVRVADIAYRLAFKPAKLDVETIHGRMRIDEFSAAYDWQGTTLRFSDADKNVRYEVRIGARRAGAR